MPLDPNYGRAHGRAPGNTRAASMDARATRQLVLFLLVVVSVCALWPVAVALDWFRANLPVSHRLSQHDIFGITLEADFLMSVGPVIAAAAALSCPFVAFLVATSHPQRAFGILVRAALAVAATALAILLLGP